MRVVIQRVNHAQVDIAGKTVGKIGKGFLLLVGIKEGDELPVVKKAADKIADTNHPKTFFNPQF